MVNRINTKENVEKRKKKKEDVTKKRRERGGGGQQFSIGGKKLSKEEFGQAKSKLGFSGGETTKGKDTSKVDAAIASRDFGKKVVKKETLQQREREPTQLDIEPLQQREQQGEQQREKLFNFGRGVTEAGKAFLGKSESKQEGSTFDNFATNFANVAAPVIGAAGIAATGLGLGATVGKLSTIAGGVAGVDAIATWAAVDNFASSIPFQLNDVLAGMRSGAIQPNEALNLLQQADNQIIIADNFVDKSTRLNPVLWVARKRYSASIEGTKRSLEIKRLLIEGTIDRVDTELEGGEDNE